MLTANNPAWEAVAKNAHALSRAARDSSIAASTGETSAIRAARHAFRMSSDGLNAPYTNTDRNEKWYIKVLRHGQAARAHMLARDLHSSTIVNGRWEGNTGQRQHMSAMDAHFQAAQAHQQAARLAAGQIPMDYGLYRDLREHIRENPQDRPIMADFYDEHGLPREARNLRLDPTGHISKAVKAFSKAVKAYRRARGASFIDDAELRQHTLPIHRAAILSSLRANTPTTRPQLTKTRHLRAIQPNIAAANHMDRAAQDEYYVVHQPSHPAIPPSREQRVGLRRAIVAWQDSQEAHAALAQYHRNMADSFV